LTHLDVGHAVGRNYQILVLEQQDLSDGGRVAGARPFPPTNPHQCPYFILVYSVLALAETFVLLAVVVGLFALLARAVFRTFRREE
jgi:hypothetical protein